MSYLFSNFSGRGRYVEDKFHGTVVAANKFIPTIVGQIITRSNNTVYYKQNLPAAGVPNTIRQIKMALQDRFQPIKISMYDTHFYFSKGLILDSMSKPLLVAVYEKEVWMAKETLEDLKPIILYSSTFFTDPKLAPLNRRLQKEILSDCYEKGMEVRILTPSIIEANTFAEIFEVKKTETLKGLDMYMSSVLPTFLYTEEEDTFVEITRDQEELLSVEEEALLYDSDATINAQPIMSTSGTNYTISSDVVFSGDTPQSWISINATDVPNIFANYPSSSIVPQGSTASAVPSVGILQQMDEQGINFASGSISLGGQAGIQLTRSVGTIELIDDTE